jgi:hypothetical protein
MSVWFLAAEQLLKLPYNSKLQSLVPTSLQYTSLMGSPLESVRASVVENVRMQEMYLPVINKHYLESE